MTTLTDKIAIVTGAGHIQGIGRAIALKLSQQGATVILTDIIDPAQLEQIAADISNETGSECHSLKCNISDSNDVNICVKQVIDKFGQIDILVNNAGVASGSTEFLGLEEKDWDLSYNVNIKGTANFCRAVLPTMLKQETGVIINNSSLCGLGAIESIPANYTASKFAIIGMTKAIALEFASENIRCNAVCPGVVNTAMRKGAVSRIAEQLDISLEEAEKVEDEAIAMKRAADPGEVADAVAYLASPAAAYITGVALPVAGGLSQGL
ncbi:MAG: SDR family NAD(P)-dependent oxidoreductase [Halieaceae bacterium]|nr:SDR family NAD(P)-dependent oxidoreductase [Halieaceae bacterium]